MCGIAGAIGPGADLDLARTLAAALRHRGPDDRGTWAGPRDGPPLCLASTRLAIIDLSAAGHMPMADERTGNVIVYNGEVYNFPELRAELEALGERFASGTDTEVVLKAYGRWGTSSVERLRGMFAFAVWDAGARELMLARDRLGEKPAYFHAATGRFLFASEVRALLATGQVPRRLDVEAVDDYLVNGFVVSPRTLVDGVRSLLPGHWMRVDGGGRVLETRRYWRLPVAPPSSVDLTSLRDRLVQSTRERMVSDVPLGAFLSGGLDSTTTVALMGRMGGDVRTFSVTFDESAFDESVHSNAAARRFATRHTEMRLRREQFEAWLPDAVAALDQPSFDGLNTYFVSRAARESGLTVALGGSGADELFGGYPFFRWAPWLLRLAAVDRALAGPARRTLGPFLRSRPLLLAGPAKLCSIWDGHPSGSPAAAQACAYQATQALFPSWTRRWLHPAAEAGERVPGLPPEFLAMVEDELPDGCSALEATSRLALRLFLGERCLRDADATSMAVSLELRAPFVDHLLVETALSYAAPRRCRGVPDKPFAWDLAAPFLGEGHPRRRKQGFIFPFERWLRAPSGTEPLAETLGAPGLAAAAGLHEPAVAALRRAFAEGTPRVPWSRVWALSVLLDWCRRHGMRA
jgi:asparagine synthase (glutamine-hydrolysing)